MRLPTDTVGLLRAGLLFTLVFGLVGTLSELLLLEHFDGWTQWIPLVLFALTLIALGWYGVSRGAQSLRVLRVLLVLFLVAGLAGVILHYRGNVEFELEMYPDLSGLKLFKEAMTGATPALAPGAMVQLGLIGLAWMFRHPALTTNRTTNPNEESTR